jgi:hypothetical protein
MQHKQLQQQQQIQQLLQQQRWAQQQQHKPLLRPLICQGQEKGPLECEQGTSGTRARQQLLRSAAPASYSSQHGAGHRGSPQHSLSASC